MMEPGEKQYNDKFMTFDPEFVSSLNLTANQV